MYLSLSHITYSYSEIPVLDDISLSVEKGEWIAIYGVSGSGKTTLLKILGTLIRARTGMYEIADKNMYSLSMGELRRMRQKTFGYIFSDHHFLEDMTVKDNILLSHTLSGTPYDTKRLDMLLETLEMGAFFDVGVKDLSTGQRDRIAIIAGLLHNPVCIIIDEPGSSLHEDMRNRLYGLLDSERKRGKIILSASHDPLLQNLTTQSYMLYDHTLHPFTSSQQ